VSGSPTYSQALYRCAVECALRRNSKRCKHRFGCMACNSCKWYITQYSDDTTDPRQIKLFMIEAEEKAAILRARHGSHHKLFAVLLALCLLAAWRTYKNDVAAGRVQPFFRSQTVIAPQAPVVNQVDYTRSYIDRTLYRVAADLRNNVDVNFDKKINCIDAAVLFYQYYPDKRKVCIEVNKHPTNGFYHLFNCVKVDGVWKAIEPQAYWTNQKSYWVRDVWPQVYDVAFNQDVTNVYSIYARP